MGRTYICGGTINKTNKEPSCDLRLAGTAVVSGYSFTTQYYHRTRSLTNIYFASVTFNFLFPHSFLPSFRAVTPSSSIKFNHICLYCLRCHVHLLYRGLPCTQILCLLFTCLSHSFDIFMAKAVFHSSCILLWFCPPLIFNYNCSSLPFLFYFTSVSVSFATQ